MPSKISPIISAILPVYNGEEHLEKCINSVLKQTFTDFEFIIVDDASTDNTSQILKEFAMKDARVKIITHKVNQKQTAAANTAINNTKGKYLARMDADDIALPIRFKKQFEFLEVNPNVGMVGSWTDTISETGKIIGQWKTASEPAVLNWNLLFGTSFAHASVMIRSSIVKEVGLYQAPEAEDYDLWSRISRVADIANLPEVLQQKRVWAGQLALKVPTETRDSVLQIMQKNMNYLLGDTILDLDTVRNIRKVFDKSPIIDDSQLISDVRNILLKLYCKYVSKFNLSKGEKKKVSRDIFNKLDTLANWQYSINFFKRITNKLYLALRFPKLFLNSLINQKK